ncbi:MAG: RNB domain-containing ribonuclease [Vicinamibacterales bacterium]
MSLPPSAHAPHRPILHDLAARAMVDRGLIPAFSPDALEQLRHLPARPDDGAAAVRDLTALAWCSIDNETSRDLDQLTVAEPLASDAIRVLVAVADVDALVPKDSPLDAHARANTTSVYTAAVIFPMLPEELSTDRTSLNPGVDRLAIVVSMDVTADGTIARSDVCRARVRNHAKLAYPSVAAWLDGKGPEPAPIGRVAGLADNLRLQDEAAHRLRQRRRGAGRAVARDGRARPVFAGDDLSDLEEERKNRATELIEDFMIAANGVTARFLEDHGVAAIRRVVRSPRRWDRLVALAREHGDELPEAPDPVALDGFLDRARAREPERFTDVSLAVVKLLGAGEYVADVPGAEAPGHFGLAVKDYTHSTAPNRRYADLVTQRLVKAVLAGQPAPYGAAELAALATHLTAQEDAANKVERQVSKSAAALLLRGRIGDVFTGIVTGASSKGTWARVFHPPVEGRVVRGFESMDVGESVRLRLVDVNVERGFIDFAGLDGHGRGR